MKRQSDLGIFNSLIIISNFKCLVVGFNVYPHLRFLKSIVAINFRKWGEGIQIALAGSKAAADIRSSSLPPIFNSNLKYTLWVFVKDRLFVIESIGDWEGNQCPSHLYPINCAIYIFLQFNTHQWEGFPIHNLPTFLKKEMEHRCNVIIH